MMKRTCLCFLLFSCMIFSCLSSVVFASESEGEPIRTNTVLPVESEALPDHEALFAGHFERTLYPDRAVSAFGTLAEERLNAVGQKLCVYLKEQVTDIANGAQASAALAVDTAVLNSWGAQTAFEGTRDDTEAVANAFWEQFDVAAVRDALLHDCPYELYWFDKTIGIGFGCGFSLQSNTLTITQAYINFYVAESYRPADYDVNTPTVDTNKTGAASLVVAKAAEIVATYKNQSDYDKLVAYSGEICDLVSYNSEIASAGSYVYGDPWQMIYVFDEDPSTNVVCEGYAKAFQYLCDLSMFTDPDVACYTVSGVMDSVNHMWNIVTMDDGNNYLVDVTNSDSNTVGASGGLFLAGGSGAIANGYVFRINRTNYSFLYDENTKSLWGIDSDSVLLLSESSYSYSAAPITITSAESFVYNGRPITAGTNGTEDITYSVGSWYTASHRFYSVDAGTNSATLMEGTPICAGEYLIEVTAENFLSMTYTKRFYFSIEKALLTVTPKPLTITYGEAPPEQITDVIAVGFVNGETTETVSFEGSLVAAHEYFRYGDIGNGCYSFAVEGWSAENYDIVYEPGVLTVEQAPVTLIWEHTEQRQWNDGKTVTATLNGLFGDDDVHVIVTGGEATEMGTHTATGSLSGAKAENYRIAEGTESVEYAIGKKEEAFTLNMDGWSYGEDASVPHDLPASMVSVRYTGTDNAYDGAEAPTVPGSYTVTVVCENENTIYTGSTEITVDKILLSIKDLVLQSREYKKDNITVSVISVELGNVLEGDTVSLDLNYLLALLPQADADTYEQVLLKNIVLLGESKEYYRLPDEITATCSVTVLPQTVSSPQIEFEANYDFFYSGSPKTPGLTVKYGDIVIPSTEYTVEYRNHTEPGMAEVLIVDREGGNYAVSGATAFAIVEKESGSMGIFIAIASVSIGAVVAVSVGIVLIKRKKRV